MALMRRANKIVNSITISENQLVIIILRLTMTVTLYTAVQRISVGR